MTGPLWGIPVRSGRRARLELWLLRKIYRNRDWVQFRNHFYVLRPPEDWS